LTYAEAAARFGISSEAVRQLAIRRHWPRRRPNDTPFGQVQVGVPDDFEARPRALVQRSDEHSDEHPSDARPNGLMADALAALEAALGEANTRADRAEQRADAAETERRGALALTDSLGAQLADAGERADAANRRADAAEVHADHADKRADAAEARAEANIQRADRAERLAEAAEARSDVNIQRADRAEARADQERLAADRFRGEADSARGELAQAVEQRTVAEERAHHLGLELTAEKAIRSAADDEVVRLRQAENERLQLGRWRRAWRGWRGQ
jgi:hypothetical protein